MPKSRLPNPAEFRLTSSALICLIIAAHIDDSPAALCHRLAVRSSKHAKAPQNSVSR